MCWATLLEISVDGRFSPSFSCHDCAPATACRRHDEIAKLEQQNRCAEGWYEVPMLWCLLAIVPLLQGLVYRSSCVGQYAAHEVSSIKLATIQRVKINEPCFDYRYVLEYAHP